MANFVDFALKVFSALLLIIVVMAQVEVNNNFYNSLVGIK